MRKLTFCVLCKAHIHGKFALCLYEAMDSLKEYEVDLKLLIGYSNLPVARSKALTEWMREHGPGDICFFLDADQTFRVEDLRSILALPGDVKCGLYANAIGECIGEPLNRDLFYKGESLELKSAGCGLMAIQWEIAKKLSEQLPLVYVKYNETVYPFFQGVIVEEEGISRWFGEDTSFCYKVRQVGGHLYGFVSPTIGHEVYKVETL